jgi:hypothetical protein
VLKVQGGESKQRWQLSRRQKKSGTYVFVAAVLAIFAYSRYSAGDTQTAAVIGVVALIVVLLGLRD